MFKESLEDFYKNKFNYLPDNLKHDLGHFNVFRLEDCLNDDTAMNYSRKDFYKISLIRGRNIYHYADKSIEISGTTLLFFNPDVPYTWESLSDDKTGFFCIFKPHFFTEALRSNIHDLPMFKFGGKPAYILNQEQEAQICNIFLKMLAEIDSDYKFKYDLIRNYVTEVIHAAMKIEPTESIYQHTDANSRITAVFTELLERQFPIESPSHRFSLRSARDFAEKLYVHVNHLNRAIKETTGKTTSNLISERLANEARALLKHTNWNISEISYCLGFEDPSHFNNFFKKHTALSPSAYRAG